MGVSLGLFPCVVFLLLLLLPLISHSSETEVVTVDIKEAKRLAVSGYTYLDVRTVEEYEKGHVDAEKILNIPYMFNAPEGRAKNPDFLKEISAVFKKEDRLVVGCQSGASSLSAATDLLLMVSRM